MSERHKWAKYHMDDEERPYYNPTFGGNLKEFIRRMVEDEGFTVTSLFPYYDGRGSCRMKGESAISKDDFESIAYQALNMEHSNIDFKHEKDGYSRTISVMMTGDSYCDMIPINDWTLNHDEPDDIGMLIDEMRNEIMEWSGDKQLVDLVEKLDGHLSDIDAQEKESAEWESNEQTRYDWSE